MDESRELLQAILKNQELARAKQEGFEFSVLKMFEAMNERFNGLEDQFKDLKEDVAVLKADVAELKEDVAVLKADVAELKADVAVLKADVAELKADVAVLKADVAGLKGDIARLDSRIDTVQAESQSGLQAIHEEAEANQKMLLAEIRGHKIEVKFKDIKNDLIDIKSELRLSRKIEKALDVELRDITHRVEKLEELEEQRRR